MTELIKTVVGAIISNGDRLLKPDFRTDVARRTVTYDGQKVKEIYIDEVTAGDNVLFVVLNEDPDNPDQIVSSYIATNIQPKEVEISAEPHPSEITIEFTAMQTVDTKATRALADRILKNGRSGAFGTPSTLYDKLKSDSSLGAGQLDPRPNPIGGHYFDAIIPMHRGVVINADPTAIVGLNTHRVVQLDDFMPPHELTYLVVQFNDRLEINDGYLLKNVKVSDGLMPRGVNETEWFSAEDLLEVEVTFPRSTFDSVCKVVPEGDSVDVQSALAAHRVDYIVRMRNGTIVPGDGEARLGKERYTVLGNWELAPRTAANYLFIEYGENNEVVLTIVPNINLLADTQKWANPRKAWRAIPISLVTFKHLTFQLA